MLNWVKQFNIFCYLDNHQYTITPHRYECVLGAGAVDFVDDTHTLSAVDRLLSRSPLWTFGHLSYDLKARLYGHEPPKENKPGFPPFFFFQPRILVTLRHDELTIHASEPRLVYEQILSITEAPGRALPPVNLQQRLSREAYIRKIEQLQQHILRGDCYEINFCQEFFSEGVFLDPVTLYQQLARLSPAPFAALYRLHDSYLVCASPERFLFREGRKIISQPMKGTAPRDLLHATKDELLKRGLQEDAKERAENVMVVDLVRNDLSRICTRSSVKVEELCGVYTFPQVHQMISTVSGQLKADASFSEIIAATFPMGSMTGAPKLRVMELIDRYEDGPRGLFSGSVGYIDGAGNFDFNVVIRSVLYNAVSGYLSYLAGSGITYYSHAAREWEECLLKGQAIKKVLTG